jgi:hypothetical protein
VLQDIIDMSVNGPREDHDGSKVTKFLHINGEATTTSFAVAIFESPYYDAKQHPVECFHFWFSMSVRRSLGRGFFSDIPFYFIF